jgi:putative hemolysin
MDTLVFVALALGLLLFSGVLSGSETAFFSLTPKEQERLRQARRPLGFAAQRLLADPGALLMTVLLANLLVNLLYLSLAAALSMRLKEEEHAVAAIGVSAGAVLLLVLAAEVLPKTLARAIALPFARMVAVPIFVLSRLLRPVAWLLTLLTRKLTRLLSGSQKDPLPQREEVSRLIEVSHRKGLIASEERRYLHEVLEFSTLKVRDVMVPRVNVAAVDLEGGREAAIEEIRQKRVSRLLAYRGDLDEIEGQVLSHQVLLRPEVPLQKLVRPLPAVPEVGTADRAKALLQRRGADMAVVVDEYGGTAGIVTLHDLTAEVVGEMADEHSHPGRRILPQSEGRFLVAGWTSLREWREKTETGADDEVAATLGGLLLRLLDRPPRRGDEVRSRWFHYRVRRVEGGRIVLIEAEKRTDLPEGVP